MHLLDSWKRSLEFFERKNFSMFGLVTLKAIKTTYGQIFRYLMVPILCVLFVEMTGFIPLKDFVWQVFIWALRIVFLFLVYLSVRSSVARKDWHYYRSYGRHALYILPLLGIIFLVLSCIGYWWWSVLTCFITFTILFFLDSRPGINNFIASYVRAVKMILYNAPSMLIVSVVLMVSWLLYMLFVQALSGVMVVPIADASFLFIPIEACVLANLYIKFLHEQFDIYFDQPK